MLISRIRRFFSSPARRLVVSCLFIALFTFVFNTVVFGLDKAIDLLTARPTTSLLLIVLILLLAREKQVLALAEEGYSKAVDEKRSAWAAADRAGYALHDLEVENTALKAKLAAKVDSNKDA